MRCLSELYSENGLFQLCAGVPVNRPGIFNLSNPHSKKELKFFSQISSRIGMELTGLAFPVVGNGCENAITLSVDGSLAADTFSLEICGGGLCVAAPNWESMERAAEYLSVKYPYLCRGETFASQQKLLKENIVKACFNAKTLEVFTLSTTEKTCVVTPSDNIQDHDDSEYNTYENVAPRLDLNEGIRILWDDLWSDDPEAALEIFLRNAMDGFKAVYPYVLSDRGECDGMICIRSGESQLCFENSDLVFCVGESGLAPLAKGYVARLQQYKDILNDGWKKDLETIFGGGNELGQAIEYALNAHGTDKAKLVTDRYSAAITDRDAIKAWVDTRTGCNTEMICRNAPQAVRSWSFEASWEGDDFLKAFGEMVLPKLKAGDKVDVQGVLSEDIDIRTQLEQTLVKQIESRGAVAGEVKIYRAFKSGSSWIEESVLPALKNAGKKVTKIDIAFRYFVNERGDDSFEDESIPNYGRHEDKPYKWFDIPIRWLQELFPVDEIIARELGISRDEVNFIRADGAEHIYTLTAYDENGAAIYNASFDAPYIEKNYMNRYPIIGKTHVSTGRLKVDINGCNAVDQRIETDPEKMWTFVEDTVLNDLERYYSEKHGVGVLPECQPLFNRLQFDLNFSEMDYDIGIRQERVSVPEAMQEDLYFYILDWFKTLGERECGKELDNVGLIMPNIHNRKGEKTTLAVALYDDAATTDYYEIAGSAIYPEKRSCIVTPLGIGFGENTCFSASVETPQAYQRAQALKELVESGTVVYPATQGFTLQLVCADRTVEISIPKYQRKASDMSEEELRDTLMHKVVDYSTYMRILDYYAQDERLRILPVGTTYLGRKMYAIELIKREKDVYYSRYKLENSRITAFFNARHHGNESTSLNSAFMLLDKMLGEKKNTALLDKLNIITLPYENIDGGEMHCEICSEHPKWLAHVARYNSAGFEFRKDFGNPNSKYGEAKVEMELWKKWLFDIVTDNHGFEGHELCQPFSGYISPWYKSFWIPRALYYGYIWYNSKLSHVESFGRRVRDAVADAINSDEEIRLLNADCAERFHKYAKAWFPDLFTSTQYKDVVFYWMDTAVRKRPNNFAVSNPEITVIDWTTEVADETVTGDDFYMNARAHLISDLALMDVIRQTPVQYDAYCVDNGFIKIRRKPLITQ